MQLKRRSKRRARHVRERLAGFAATLLAAAVTTQSGQALAQDYSGDAGYGNEDDAFGPGIAYSQIDSAVLVYQESGSRVRAIEPAIDLSVHSPGGDLLTLGVVADAVSGATPNGAVPSDRTQTFVTPVKARGSTATVTGASGGSTIIQLPPTPGQVAQAALGRQYVIAPNVLPVDKGFHDHRGAFNFGWSQPLGVLTDVGFGAGYSLEQDYRVITGNVHADQTFNSNNTTLSLSVNVELDSSFPYGGVPTPFTQMTPQWKTPTARGKTQTGFVLGLTQVLTRNWLAELNYAFDVQDGYLNDPYRVISVVDPVSGEPGSYLYESRPRRRQSQSIFFDNKFDFGPSLTEVSFRYFKDDWGITSKTADISERVKLTDWFYIEPNARWYQQSAANFFHNYLVAGQTQPLFASSDSRLGKFTSYTYGLKLGFDLTGNTELYLRGEYYRQLGQGHPAGAIGQLAHQNLFSGTNAAFVLLGYSWDFH
jgi:hypothetical protein